MMEKTDANGRVTRDAYGREVTYTVDGQAIVHDIYGRVITHDTNGKVVAHDINGRSISIGERVVRCTDINPHRKSRVVSDILLRGGIKIYLVAGAPPNNLWLAGECEVV